jgi:hypothetical protein
MDANLVVSFIRILLAPTLQVAVRQSSATTLLHATELDKKFKNHPIEKANLGKLDTKSRFFLKPKAEACAAAPVRTDISLAVF